MRYKYLFLTTFSLVFFLGWTSLSYLQVKENLIQELELSITSSKKTYVIGETVNFTFDLKNKGNDDLTRSNNFNIDAGYLKVYISKDGKNFEKYSNPNWGRIDAAWGVVQLKPNESVKTSADVLWNEKPEVSHLSPKSARQSSEGKILTDYVFPKAGEYFVKATFIVHYQMRANKIESEPIQITIEEPSGDDSAVWNKIKDRGDLAYFIQEGRFRTRKSEEQEKLKQEIEQSQSVDCS